MQFFTEPLKEKLEITGHPVLRVSMSLAPSGGSNPTDMDLFVTLRHIGPDGKESKRETYLQSSCCLLI